jgi:hypothetical protein
MYATLFKKNDKNAHAHIRAHLLTPMNARRHYPYKHLRRLSRRPDLEIDEVIIGASLSTETSPPTERKLHLYETYRYQT